MNSQVAIITDSVAQVSEEISRELNIQVIPFNVIINDLSYPDGIIIKPAELYRRMRSEKLIPSTSHPSVGYYTQTFSECLERRFQAVIYLSVSSRLSGAFSTATKAAQLVLENYPDRKITVVDSRNATISQGFIAIEAARAANVGDSLDQILDRIQSTIPRVGFYACLDTLEYLALGGRIGKASYMLGSLIKIKPILTLNEEGLVKPISQVRGELNAVLKIIALVAGRVQGRIILKLAVMEADAQENAQHLQKLAREKFGVEEVPVTDFTPVMGAHTGPGVIGLAFLLE